MMFCGFFRLVRIGIPAELEIDSPDIVGLPVQQHALVAMERRIEPEPALGGEAGLHLDVGDQEAVLETAAVAFQAEQTAQRRARAVAGDDMVGSQFVGAIRRLDPQPDMIVMAASRR